MAKIKVDVIADASSLRAAMAEVKGFSGTVESSFGSAAKSALGFATAFVGVGGLVEAITKSVAAGEDLNKASRMLDAQLRANGESVKAIAPYIDTLNQNMEKLGFTNAQTEEAFTRLDRASGSAALAYQAMGVAADLARAKHIDLSQAALLVGKVIDGTTSALNRYGIAIPKGTSVTEALAIAQQKLAGQAQASVTPMDQFRATITDLEAKIGQALLPTIDRYLGKVTEWLQSSQHQKEIIDTVKSAVHDFTVVIGDLTKGVEAVLPYVKQFTGLFATGLVATFNGVKAAVKGVGDALDHIFGTNKGELIAGVTAIGIAISLAIGPEATAIVGAIAAVGLIKDHWKSVVNFFKTLGQELTNVFEYAWVEIQRGALEAALGILKALDFTVLGHHLIPGVHSLVNDIQHELNSLHPPDMSWSAAAKQAGASAGSTWGAAFSAAAASALTQSQQTGGIPLRRNPQGTVVPPAAGSGTYSTKQIYSLLINAGFTPDQASNFVGIAGAESGGRYGVLNNNPKTGDYSIGLWQENFFKNLGPSRVARYAPQFGLSGNMPVDQFVAWLGQHPAAQASIAHDLFTSSGYSPWKGDAFVSAHPELLAGSLPPGSTAPPDMGGKGGKKKPPAFKIPDALEAQIRAAQDAFKNDVSQSHLAILTGLLTQEENLLKQHHELAKASAVANEITDAQKKLADAYDKAAAADVKAAGTDASKAAAAFAKGQIGPAETYTKAEVKNLADAKRELEKAITAAPAADRGAYEKQLAAVEKQLAGLKGAAGWIEAVGKIVAEFGAKLKTEGDAYQKLLSQRTAQSELQAVGYFKDTQDALVGTDTAIVANLKSQASTLQGEIARLKAKLASAPAGLKAGLESQISTLSGHLTTVTSSISQAMGTVEQDLVGALQQAQSAFQTAAGNLQTNLDNQLQTMAENASGYTADITTLNQMQAADQLGGLQDALSGAQQQLAKDTAAGASATQDQVAADQKAVNAAQRAIDEYNLQIKAQQELTQANATAKTQTDALNAKLGDLESQLLSGKITADQFQEGLKGLQAQFGVTINDTVTPELVAVASSAQAVVSAFNALIAWVNQQTGSNIPPVGSSGGGGGGGGGGVDSSGNMVGAPGHLKPTGGFYSGGMVHALTGLMVPGPPLAHDYVPILANGGEMILTGAQQANLFSLLGGGASAPAHAYRMRGGGNTYQFNFPNYVGDKRELIQLLRTELQREAARNR